ncbi:hypothetical protein PMG11_09405 [Penicillium brasilianum]|uniref:Rhodopsin domain-containing protein n=1 Tax=Penicillium brasilianum TaxID=104259 RepID=A0A0F7TW01_PENBI|nr:hypothetical protein PMG11_09405 [Penicillium brasilianum]
MEVVSADPSTPFLQVANQVLVAVGLTLSTACLAMRLYTKSLILRKFWWDDVCLIFAWTLSIGTQATILHGYTFGGIGRHFNELSPETVDTLLKVILAAAVIYIPCLAFAKLSLLMLYYSILNTSQEWVYSIYIIAFVISGYSLALALALIFACNPIQKGWDISIPPGVGSCINRPGVYLATAVSNTLSDVILILIPIRVVWGLQMRLIQKLGVVAMFCIGCLTIITSILRLATLWPLVTTSDVSYKLALASVFINIEANFIIICASLPYLRQLTRHHKPKCCIHHRSNRNVQAVRSLPSWVSPQDDTETV